MAEKAEQIQKLWEPKEGDDFAYRDSLGNMIVDKIGVISDGRYFSQWIVMKNSVLHKNTYFSESWQSGTKYKAVWLPTEEELQEMWWDRDSGLHPKDLFHWFSNVLKIYEDYFYQFLSPKELWFAVVMKESYHRIWDGKVWIEGERRINQCPIIR